MASSKPTASGRGALPVEMTSFVGRRRELAETRQLLASSRLLTLTGPGGVGKTRLALRMATEVRRTFPDGYGCSSTCPPATGTPPSLSVPTKTMALESGSHSVNVAPA